MKFPLAVVLAVIMSTVPMTLTAISSDAKPPRASGVTCAQIAQTKEGDTLSQMIAALGEPEAVLSNADGDYTLQFGAGDAFNGAFKDDIHGPIVRVLFGKHGKLADRVLMGIAYGCVSEGVYGPQSDMSWVAK
jgi:outer membrane protein assembly factor BamE (lipoprotein component of BamABCDE complex)